MWYLNEAIAIYLTVLCGIVVVFLVGTTLVPCFTTASPFKTPLSDFLGNLSMRIRGGKSLEEEEKENVKKSGVKLDEDAFTWLMNYTRNDDIYREAVRAQKELRRRQAERAGDQEAIQYP